MNTTRILDPLEAIQKDLEATAAAFRSGEYSLASRWCRMLAIEFEHLAREIEATP